MQNAFQYQYPPVICYGCGFPGHIKRNCFTELGLLGPPPNVLANRGSKDFQGQTNVYIMTKLLGKKIPCLVDSGCDLTIVPKSLTDRFKYFWKPNLHRGRFGLLAILLFKLMERLNYLLNWMDGAYGPRS